ncbi:hypothetical protein FQN53_006404 [Emmonsiellopsis sp. PD_33]|nr:hypothetical protein FQN53_006404 [Emmonsiellopsis sp. PD_33]
MAPPKTVVVVGGSWAGIKTAHGILKGIPNTKVVLINPSRNHYWNIASPRILAKPAFFNPNHHISPIPDIFQKYDQKLFSFVQGAATAIDVDGKTVTVALTSNEGKEDTDSTIHFDYLVIASGSTSVATLGQNSVLAPFKPTGSDDLISTIKQSQKTISEARSVILGGAGAVGVEFAGELAEALKGKEGASVTLLTGTDRILPDQRPRVIEKAHGILTNLGVKIRTSVMVSGAALDPSTNKWTVSLEGGETLTADAYISTTGVIPNNSFIPEDLLTAGWVTVDEEFRVQRKGDKDDVKLPIYAVGDITTRFPRLLNTIAAQVAMLLPNLKADIQGLSGKRSLYKDPLSSIVIPIGASTGTGHVAGWILWGWLVWLIKGRDYFLMMKSSMLMS